MSQQSSTTICSNPCRDRVKECRDIFSSRTSPAMSRHKNPLSRQSCLLIFIMLQLSLLCRNIYQSIPLILCRDRVVKCRDNLHFYLEFNTYSLLRHSIACCNIASACSIEIMSRHFEIMSRLFCLSQFFCFS